MKNTQLRRGNKVLHNGVEKTIDCISPGWVIFLEDRKVSDDFGQWVDLDEVEFIPLTEEWLLKFGFKEGEWKDKTSSQYLYHANGTLHISDSRDVNYSFESPCKYVHQLQNLYFALTNTEIV